MTPSQINDLANRIETEAPSRELDAEVALAKGWWEARKDWFLPPSGKVLHHKSELPLFTTSVDAALSLVPEGCFPKVHKVSCDYWRCHLGRGNRGIGTSAIAATPAQAITAAALRGLGAS